MKKNVLIIALFLSLLAGGCKDKSVLKPNISGAMGEVLMVMDDKWRNSPAGDSIKAVLMQPMEGLPQIEPIFKLSITPHRAFTDNIRTFRNIVITNVGEDVQEEGVRYRQGDTYAKGQAMVQINAKTAERFIELVDENQYKILAFLLKAERQRSINYYDRYEDAQLADKVGKQWGLDMIIPNILKIRKMTDTFTWLSNETPTMSQGLMVYSFDYHGENVLTKEYLLNKRDSVLHVNVPGPSDGSYMSTEYQVPVTYKVLEVNGHYTVEMRGLWKVVGDLMGGPFVLFAHLDYENSKVIVTDSYVYLPDEPKKRNFVWQMESLLYTVKFPGDEKPKS
ncbi:DUF4837 family protein [Geofilum sp. OHC36d9]|uniref:DUF4837 family protein n=1 Tax=Geofilum sp. OHC36d9 TaxID=3458413 RepID=UPI0040338898